jgi:hypothetical protein
MDFLKKIFPFSFRVSLTNDLVIAIIIYAVIGILGGVILGLMAKIPYVGFLFGIALSVVEVYSTAGIVLSILHFTKVIK